MKKKFYVTTPLYYPTAKPHLGTAYTTIVADILSRWYRLKDYDVFFLTGTDEHGQKLEEAAEKAGLPIKKFVDNQVKKFKKVWSALNIEFDGFIRTTDKKHEEIVKKLIKKIYDNGELYEGEYKGLYCVPCESYWTEKDLIAGKCPSCLRNVKQFKEKAYFFKLSKYKKKLLDLYDKKDLILPESKRNEIVNRVKQGLKDISFTRSKFKWGVEFPPNKNYVLWVWADALINYISALDWPLEKFKKYWPADVHLIGKDILWFHAVIWPAMLLSIGIKPPKRVFAHGWWTVEGEKMSKSKGNIIDPLELVRKYSADSFRYYLAKFPFGEDGDFNEEELKERYNNELANKFGNLISRVTSLAEKNRITKCENKLIGKLKLKEIEKKIENYEFDKALNEIFAFIDICNEYVQKNKLWETRDKKKLYELVDSIKVVTILLSAFIPSACEKISKSLGFKLNWKEINKPIAVKKIKKQEILFKKI